MSSRDELDALKASISLLDVLAANGVTPKRNGRGYKASCPFHEDKTPSFSVDPAKGLYHCFSCGKAGDALTFLQEHKSLDFSAAVAELKRFAAHSEPAFSQAHPKPLNYELLERIVHLYHQQLGHSPEGLEYLKKRGIEDLQLLRDLRVGYAPPRFLATRATETERAALRELGLLDERGKELFAGCVVMPLRDASGRVTGLWGRACDEKAAVRHRSLPGPRRGMFWPEAARGASRVLLVEGPLDALACAQAGFSNVLALGGTQGLTQELLDHLKGEKVTEAVLLLDSDAAGERAMGTLRQTLEEAGFSCAVVKLPEGEDPASFLASHPREHLGALLDPKPSIPATNESWKGEFKKLSKAQGKLKVLVRLERDGKKAQDTLDLYSKRSRRQSGLMLARELDLDLAELETWFFHVMDELSKEELSKGEDAFAVDGPPPMTAEEKEEALAYLRRPDLVGKLLEDLEALGYIGDEDAKLLCYLISISRKLKRPMSGILQSGSGAGKSYLAELIAKVTPPEEVVLYSRLSQQALYYMPEDFLVQKLLMLEERVGGEASDYQIRTLQSSQFLYQAIVIKDPSSGKLMTRTNRVNGPIAYLETTTQLKLNPENTSRCFEIPLDESSEQTQRIHVRQRHLKGLEGLLKQQNQDGLLGLHHRAQRLLEPIPVVIPYVEHLTFPDRWLRTRRDHERFLCLIEALAFLHQHQRPHKTYQGVEYIEANLEDYRWAYRLAARVLPNSLDELSRWARELLNGLRELPLGATLTRREIRERLRWPDHRTRDALEELTQMEYLEQLRGPSNLYLYRLYELTAPAASILGLLVPDELERRISA